jgi:hypothetical protein
MFKRVCVTDYAAEAIEKLRQMCESKVKVTLGYGLVVETKSVLRFEVKER